MSDLGYREASFLDRVRRGMKLRLADREEDRVRQKCRKMGLVEVVKNPRRWVITEAGVAALQAKKEQAR